MPEVKKDNSRNQLYNRELKYLEKAKEIGKGTPLSKDDLLEEFLKLRKEYDKLLRQTIKITRIGDANQRKLMRLWRLEQDKLQLAQILKERTDEIEEKNRQLEKQSEKLQDMDRLKSRFFANISHEFRTPLNLIMGPLEQLLNDYEDKELIRKVKLMLRNSQRLLNLINQMLDLSKLDSGKMKLQVSLRNIVPILKGIMNSFDSFAVENELAFIFTSGEENITLYLDAGKLEDAVGNLLVNAVKFTPPGGEITLSVKASGESDEHYPSGHVTISVHDTGVGIPADQLPYVFDRFYQVEGFKGGSYKGTGIGLALAKELVSLHHGNITVQSSPGEGTEFIIRLPFGDTHYKAGEIIDDQVEKVEAGPRLATPGLYKDEIETGRSGDMDPADESEYDIKKAKQERPIILVVEDSVEMRNYIREVLEALYRVVEAKNGREGIHKAQKIVPDLIISDVMMPEVDGYELCNVLKNDRITSHVPIVLLTAKASEDSIIDGLETGADDYIIKPFSTKILKARIENLITLRRQLQQKVRQQSPLQPEELALSKLDKEFIEEFRDTIDNHLSDPEFNVDKLRKKLYMSRATLYRKIEALTGESPTDIIRSYRLDKAAELLKNKSGSVLEVSAAVGFSSSAYFTKCFKDKFGKLPSAYRKQ